MDRDRKAPIEGFSGRHYFMTIVAQGRACLFGEVVENQMRLNEAGGMVQEVCWGLSQRFPGVEVGSFVVMPNHVHGIIVLQETVGASLVGAQCEDNGQPRGLPLRWGVDAQGHFLFCINPRIHPIASGSAVKIPADRSPTAHRDVTIRPPRSVLPYQAPNKISPWVDAQFS